MRTDVPEEICVTKTIPMDRLYCKALLLALLSLSTFSVRAQELRKVIEHPQPVFPETAKDMTLKGTARVEVIVGSDGLIKNTRVIGGHPLLVQATLEALKKWRYAPAKTETTMALEFNFRP